MIAFSMFTCGEELRDVKTLPSEPTKQSQKRPRKRQKERKKDNIELHWIINKILSKIKKN